MESTVPGGIQHVPGTLDTGDELTVADAWIFSALSNDPALEAIIGNDDIYPEKAPNDAAPPFVTYTVLDPSSDWRGTGSIRLALRPLYLVRVYGLGATYFGPIRAAYKRVDELLHRRPGSPVVDPPGYVDGCWRERPFRQRTTEGEEIWSSLGGEYRLHVRAGS